MEGEARDRRLTRVTLEGDLARMKRRVRVVLERRARLDTPERVLMLGVLLRAIDDLETEEEDRAFFYDGRFEAYCSAVYLDPGETRSALEAVGLLQR